MRAITPAGHVGENFGVPQQLTGDWQTLSFTVAAPASWVGGALGVQAASSLPDVDNPFQIAGVQVERGACSSAYSKVTF